MNFRIFKAVLAVLIFMLTLTACGKDNKKNRDSVSSGQTVIVPFNDDGSEVVEFDDTDDETQFTTDTTTTTLPPVTTTTVPQRNNKYKVGSKKYTSKNSKTTIIYPQISGLYDEDMQDFYNELFKSDVIQYEKGNTDKENLDLKYKVTLKSKDMLSIVIYGSIYYEDVAHPYSYAYAYNIDLATGCTVVPSAAVNAEKAAKSLIYGGDFNVVYSETGIVKSDVVESFADSDLDTLKEQLIETDVITVKKNKKGEYVKSGMFGCRSYLDANSDPILIVEVLHALGDYVELEFH